MPFYPADAPISNKMRTDAFVLRPLRTSDNALDYDAVMATGEILRQRGSGTWPRPNFTPEENLVDLEGHEADFNNRAGFTYTVLHPTETRCLGCVYVYPLADALRRVGADDETVSNVGNDEALTWFWVRPDASAADIDRHLLTTLIPWLRNDFAFARVVFLTWASENRQLALMQDAGLSNVRSYPVGASTALHFE